MSRKLTGQGMSSFVYTTISWVITPNRRHTNRNYSPITYLLIQWRSDEWIDWFNKFLRFCHSISISAKTHSWNLQSRFVATEYSQETYQVVNSHRSMCSRIPYALGFEMSQRSTLWAWPSGISWTWTLPVSFYAGALAEFCSEHAHPLEHDDLYIVSLYAEVPLFPLQIWFIYAEGWRSFTTDVANPQIRKWLKLHHLWSRRTPSKRTQRPHDPDTKKAKYVIVRGYTWHVLANVSSVRQPVYYIRFDLARQKQGWPEFIISVAQVNYATVLIWLWQWL